jgi:hypothetical protein
LITSEKNSQLTPLEIRKRDRIHRLERRAQVIMRPGGLGREQFVGRSSAKDRRSGGCSNSSSSDSSDSSSGSSETLSKKKPRLLDTPHQDLLKEICSRAYSFRWRRLF